MHGFPYTNFHEMNLDWILNKIAELEAGNYSEVLRQLGIKSVKDYGAIGDGITDDTPAIKTALADLTTGDTLLFPAGTYCINETLIIGNGTNLIDSTINAIHLVGDGRAKNDAGSATIIKWTGSDSSTMLEVHGPIAGLTINGFLFDGQSVADVGWKVMCVQGAEVSQITISNCRSRAFWLTQWMDQPGTKTTNNIMGYFRNIECRCPDNTNAICFDVGGLPGNSINDTNMSVFENLSFYRNASGIGLRLGFTDACTYRNIIGWKNGSATDGHDILLDGTEYPTGTFPGAILFENISASIDTLGSTGAITVLGYGMGDGEHLPEGNPNIRGWTHSGLTIGSWTEA